MDFPKVKKSKVDISNQGQTLIIGLNLKLRFKVINHITNLTKQFDRIICLTNPSKQLDKVTSLWDLMGQDLGPWTLVLFLVQQRG